MKKLYGCMNEFPGFVYYQDDNGAYRFADNASDVALTGPIDAERVVWDDNFGYIFDDGTELPWAEEA